MHRPGMVAAAAGNDADCRIRTCLSQSRAYPHIRPAVRWEAVADVIDDYFKIQREEPVRQIGDTFNEGRIDTYYQVSPTLLEPWRRDTAGEYERVENTLQTMRRKAVVRVWPTQGGHWVEVAVFKELEDLRSPEHASAGSATFRYDSSFTRVVNPEVMNPSGEHWIPEGRDPVLEQRIIGHLIYNCNELGYNLQAQGPGFAGRLQDSGFRITKNPCRPAERCNKYCNLIILRRCWAN